jgi:hypothetical protein
MTRRPSCQDPDDFPWTAPPLPGWTGVVELFDLWPLLLFELPLPLEEDPLEEDPLEEDPLELDPVELDPVESEVLAAALVPVLAAYTAADAIPAVARQPTATVAVMPAASRLPLLRVSMACS